jgi:hypothetical protein
MPGYTTEMVSVPPYQSTVRRTTPSHPVPSRRSAPLHSAHINSAPTGLSPRRPWCHHPLPGCTCHTHGTQLLGWREPPWPRGRNGPSVVPPLVCLRHCVCWDGDRKHITSARAPRDTLFHRCKHSPHCHGAMPVLEARIRAPDALQEFKVRGAVLLIHEPFLDFDDLVEPDLVHRAVGWL